MKWIKCLYNGGHETLTVGKIYKVLSISHFSNTKTTTVSDRVCIINDLGNKDYLSLITCNDKPVLWFEDATNEVRDNIINDILE
jgi:hypothetical protein